MSKYNFSLFYFKSLIIVSQAELFIILKNNIMFGHICCNLKWQFRWKENTSLYSSLVPSFSLLSLLPHPSFILFPLSVHLLRRD